ncbi:MAG: hypothetical protein AAF638_03175 [Pseudomonadota bacterium]
MFRTILLAAGLAMVATAVLAGEPGHNGTSGFAGETAWHDGPLFTVQSSDVFAGPAPVTTPAGLVRPPGFVASSGAVDPGIVDLNPQAPLHGVVGVDVDQRQRHRSRQ